MKYIYIIVNNIYHKLLLKVEIFLRIASPMGLLKTK
jgi:hypothetical protein